MLRWGEGEVVVVGEGGRSVSLVVATERGRLVTGEVGVACVARVHGAGRQSDLRRERGGGRGGEREGERERGKGEREGEREREREGERERGKGEREGEREREREGEREGRGRGSITACINVSAGRTRIQLHQQPLGTLCRVCVCVCTCVWESLRGGGRKLVRADTLGSSSFFRDTTCKHTHTHTHTRTLYITRTHTHTHTHTPLEPS